MRRARADRDVPATEGPRRGRAIASGLVIALAAGGLTYAATRSTGETVHRSELDDGGVWVTSDVQARFGRLNTAIKQLDAGVSADVAENTSIDVLQDRAAIVGVSAGNQLVPIDGRTGQASSSTTAAPAPQAGTGLQVYVPPTVDLRGGTAAMIDPRSGKVWATRVDPQGGVTDLSALRTSDKPVATVGEVGALAVGTDGAVHAVSGATGEVVTVPVAGDGFGKPRTQTIGGMEAKAVDITAVGSTWVVYDPTKDALHVDGVEEPQTGVIGQAAEGELAYAALQQPGPASEVVGIEGQAEAKTLSLKGSGDVNPGVQLSDQTSGSPAKITRPVVVGSCLHAAWAATGAAFYGAACGGEEPTRAVELSQPKGAEVRSGVKFRQNRRQLVLNDLDTGGVWDLEDEPERIDNWDSLVQPKKQDDTKKKDKNLVDDSVTKQPPKAEPDSLTVRAGTTSTLHVLDNDTDTTGSILAIAEKDLTQPDKDVATATVSGDGQSIDVAVPTRSKGSTFEFTYKANNGKATSGKAAVRVRVVGDDVNTAPALRPGKKTLSETAYPVLPGKRVELSMIGDWRDPESDPVALEAVDPLTSVDGGGKLTVVGSEETGRREVKYAVDDGHGGRSTSSAKVTVLDPANGSLVAPQTQPDVVRAIVGKPVQIEPLANDVPGADPSDPNAEMQLASEVTSKGDLTVDTDLGTGVVTVTPRAAGVQELSYAARVGGGVDPGRIRLDVQAAADPQAPPVALPDTATVRDQAPTVVDVLANDYSPRGDVLVTKAVQVDGDAAQWLRPSIYQGRWVRLEATTPAPLESTAQPRRGTVTYTVSDGDTSATATVSVTQKPPLAQEQPVVEDDEATVRVGDAVTVPVLDNDTMASGVPLTVDAASVQVVDGGGDAFASGNLLRYVPPADLTEQREVVLEYAAYPEGVDALAQTARVRVQVNPAPTKVAPNRAPVARSFSSSVVAGEKLVITVPTSGVDPDGDTVTLTGIVGKEGDTIDLRRGRVTTIGASSITYESYPRASGTEVITYEVADRFGERSQGFVRVGVVQPGDPQPPVAVLDEVRAQPGRTVNVSILRNDLIARGDPVTVEYKDLNTPESLTGWTVDEDSYEVRTKAPEPDAPAHQLTYGIDNGLFDPSRASVLVRGEEDFVNPPTAVDDVAKPQGKAATIDVDVLANDYDLDSASDQLTVSKVLSDNASVIDGQVRVKILSHPHVVPYVIKDIDGATAMALIYVPTGNDGRPFLIPDKVIGMDADSTKGVAINDYVKSPRGRDVAITAAETVSTSPDGDLDVEVTGRDTVELTSSNGYVGPASLMLEVSDQQEDAQSTAAKKDFGTAYVTIPVQIGPKVPLLRCPVDFRLTLNAGGRARDVDIPSLCHAWVPQGMTLDDAQFESSWDPQPQGTELTRQDVGERRLDVRSSEDAPAGEGSILVKAKGAPEAEQGRIGVQVIPRAKPKEEEKKDPKEKKEETPEVPQPRLRPVSIQGLKEGSSQSVDLRSYLDSPLDKPACTIAEARLESGKGVEVTSSGCVLTVTATEQPSRDATVALTVSDGPDRFARGRARVTLLGKPSAPSGVSATADRDTGGRASVRFAPPTYTGGSPITGYRVSWGGDSQVCRASPCTISGLTNGQKYSFTVRALNSSGAGDPSPPSNSVTPDTRPGAVSGVRTAGRGDGFIQIAWSGVANKGSDPIRYTVRAVSEAGVVRTQSVSAPSQGPVRVGGLDNDQIQNVQVQAINKAGAGPFSSSVRAQSAGTPPPVGRPTLSARGATAADDAAALQISWPATRANGPALTRYTLYRRVQGGSWAQVTTTSPAQRQASTTVPYDGKTYQFVVTATNGADKTSPQTNVASFSSNGIPETPRVSASTPSKDYKARYVVSLGSPRSSGYSAIRWTTTSGRSGTHTCSGGCSGQVSITTPPLSDLGGTESNQTVSVVAVNSAGKSSQPARSNSYRPYGPTRKPEAVGSGWTNGVYAGNVSFKWTLPENGRPVDDVELYVVAPASQAGPRPPFTRVTVTIPSETQPGTVTIRVRAHSSAGWSGWTTISGRSSPPPPPSPARMSNVRKGQSFTNGTGDCANTTCYKPNFTLTDVKPGSYGLQCRTEGAGTFYQEENVVKVNADQSWSYTNGFCGYTENNSRVRVVLFGGPSGTVDPGWASW